VIRAEDAEVSVLGSNPVIKEVLVQDQRTIDLLNTQIQGLNAKVAESHKTIAELRGKIAQGDRIVTSVVEKIIEKPVEKMVEVEKWKEIKVRVPNWPLAYAGAVGALVGALLCYTLLSR